ncbi:MAG: hypothetical protein IKD09_05700 [Lentisphaeria bacterium]|nr:hypothetical protein [Lentisphaeria bacterium]
MKNFFRIFGVSALLFAVNIMQADEAQTNDATVIPLVNPDGSPIVKTEEDIAKGKENVNAVVEELQELFSYNIYPNLQNIKAKPIAPAYTKISHAPNGYSTLVYRTRFTDVDRVYRAIDGLATTDATVEVIKERNMVMISDKTENINYYKNLLETIDIPSPQVLIEAKVVEVIFNDGMQRNLSMGFNDGTTKVATNNQTPGETNANDSGISGSFSPGNFNIDFNWLLTASDAKVISSPNILVSRNEIAKIVTAEEIPIQEANSVNNSLSFSTVFKQVGVTLEVEPLVINDDGVLIRLYPRVSTVLRYENFSTGGADKSSYPVPVVSVRSAESYLRMQNQQVVTLGGLYTHRNILQQERTPVLSDIPIIGELFTGKNKSKEVVQLLFFIKVHIIPPAESSKDLIYNPNTQAVNSNALGRIIDNKTVIPDHEKGISGFAGEIVDSLDASWSVNGDYLQADKVSSKEVKTLEKAAENNANSSEADTESEAKEEK